jgi:3-hydroxyisobutyrate dehydrogenase
MKRIGLIGTGVMGTGMGLNLLEAGFELAVTTRTPQRARELLEAGAQWRDGTKALVADRDVVLTMVGYPRDVEQVYLGPGGVVEHAAAGSLWVDATTSSPALAERVAAAAAGRGCLALDAPVSGGDVGARAGTLSVMVGGPPEAFEQGRPVLDAVGATVVHQGPAGSGQHTKMCNQIAAAGTMITLCESIAYARASGLDPATVLKNVASGAAGSWAMTNLAPRILEGDFAPGFYVKHFIKDLGIALESAEAMGLELPGLALAKSLYERLAADGGGDLGTQGLMRVYGG